MKKSPRGIRNHNPGNIRHGSSKWQGLAEEQPDSAFCSFSKPVFGLRALAKLLLTYNRKHGLNTLYGILNRYAPTIENDTNSYIMAVAKRIGVNQHDEIEVKAHLLPMIQAIVAHENGKGWDTHYSEELYLEAIKLATA